MTRFNIIFGCFNLVGRYSIQLRYCVLPVFQKTWLATSFQNYWCINNHCKYCGYDQPFTWNSNDLPSIIWICNWHQYHPYSNVFNLDTTWINGCTCRHSQPVFYCFRLFGRILGRLPCFASRMLSYRRRPVSKLFSTESWNFFLVEIHSRNTYNCSFD